jgi:steroid 5-alpha reductase family enzyme
MIKSVIFFCLLLIVVIVFSFFVHPQPLSGIQWHMMKISGIIVLSAALVCFIIAELTKNYSQIDKIWSIIPVVYLWLFAAMGGWDGRVTLMALCATVWGARLTYNFYRKGAYKLKFWTGEEDYRWEHVRQTPVFKKYPMVWRLFSFFFIAVYQSFLLWSITLPAVMAYTGTPQGLSMTDYLLAFTVIALVIIEATADQQQHVYQTEKHRLKKAGEKADGIYAAGFIQSGLWSYARHPNYLCEQLIWVMLYLFSVVATGIYINWSAIGCLLLILLFQGSADLTEKISLSKYPAYADYIKRVPKFIPGSK